MSATLFPNRLRYHRMWATASPCVWGPVFLRYPDISARIVWKFDLRPRPIGASIFQRCAADLGIELPG